MPSKLAPRVEGPQGYRLLGWLGEGASSTVWRAADTEDRQVVLKRARGAAQGLEFALEAARLAACHSTLLPQLVDVGLWQEVPFLATEWVEGRPLDRVLKTDAKAGDRRALLLARDVGGALADLHAAGLAHGDVKLENILQVEAPREGMRLLDIGLATDVNGTELRGATPRYFPDAGSSLGNARARDLFALGIVLAEAMHPDLLHLPRPADEARERSRSSSLADRLVSALLAEEAGARPDAEWVASQAARELGTDQEDTARRLGRLRMTYLGVRMTELGRAVGAEEVVVQLGGEPRVWVQQWLDLARKGARLHGGELRGAPCVVGESDELTRALWLVSMVGASATSWSHAALASRSDEAWAKGLGLLCAKSSPSGWGLRDVERALAEGAGAERATAHPPPTSSSSSNQRAPGPWASDRAPTEEQRLALAIELASANPDPEAIALVEGGPVDFNVLRSSAAGALARRGELGRALALLRDAHDREAVSLRADLERRAGDRTSAARDARQVLRDAPQDPRSRYVLGRLLLLEGKVDEAATWFDAHPDDVLLAEGRSMTLAAQGQGEAALRELSIAQSMAKSEEALARLAGLLGFVAHQRGESQRALDGYTRASEHAARAGAVLEEATYRTGEAASAVDCGSLTVALEASRRAILLWHHLKRPAEGARALLARASAYAAAGASLQAVTTARDARDAALLGKDLRAAAYAIWTLADHAAPSDAASLDELRQSLTWVEGHEEDRLRCCARLGARGAPEVDRAEVQWGDGVASKDRVVAVARLEWWTYRAQAGADAAIVAAICRLSQCSAPPSAKGPALHAGYRLASELGDGDSARVLLQALFDLGREALSRTPVDLRESFLLLPWVRAGGGASSTELSTAQIGHIESIFHALAARDRLKPLLEQILDALILWTGVERGMLLLRAPDGTLVCRAARNLSHRQLSGEQRLLSHSIANEALRTQAPVVALDALGELPSSRASVHALKLRSVLAVPLFARGEAMGVVYLDDRVRAFAFGARELSWVKFVASVASIAIADAKDQILLRRAVRKAERSRALLQSELAQRQAELDGKALELVRLREQRGLHHKYDDIVGRSGPMRTMLQLVDRVTGSSVPVLLLGESGSGKELVARAIHDNGARSQKPFVGENCSAIPETLLEATLFGHVKGAFTGADRARAGLFEIAHGGTLFLDEIGEMSLGMQSKLLRLLEDGLVRPLGSEKGRRVDVRILGATHQDLTKMVADGRFRADLYYRLNVIAVRVPALRERLEDVPLLVLHFIEHHAQGRRIRASKEAMARLCAYAWPGNVRQLENEIRRAVVLCESTILVEHLSSELQVQKPTRARPTGELHLRSKVDELEQQLVREALLRTSGNQTKAAALLGLSRYGLQKMIKRLGIS